jgi:hypothetical protein
LGGLGTHGREILKWMLEQQGGKSHLAQDRVQ